MATIIWHVGTEYIPAFEYALLAVRATNIIKESIRTRRDPPNPFPIHELAHLSPKAQLSEIKDLLNFQHLVRCVEQSCLNSYNWCSDDKYFDPPLGAISADSPPSNLRIWRERFYRAIYKLFLAGAVFYTNYNEPFSTKAERPMGVPREYLMERNDARRGNVHSVGSGGNEPYWDCILPLDGANYLQRFPVYSVPATEDQEKLIFGPFAEWLVEDGKRLAEENQCQEQRHFDSSKVSCIWEIMVMLRAHHDMMGYLNIVNGDGQYGHSRGNSDDDNPPVRQALSGPTREVSVIFYGVFGLEDISMPASIPANIDDASEFKLVANPAGVYRESANAILDNHGVPTNVDIYSIQDFMFNDAGFPNHYKEDHPRYESWHPMPRPNFLLFAFTLKEYFNLQFRIDAFDNFDRYRPWQNFIYASVIYRQVNSINRPYGFYILSDYEPRIRCYRRMI